MKKVMGISLGSSKRDHAVTVSLLGQECRVERVGMDGDMERMIETIKALDEGGAFGLGGISVNLYSIDRRYQLRDARRIMEATRLTPSLTAVGLKKHWSGG